MTVTTPVLTLVRMPEDDPTVATEGLLTVHVPPLVASLKVTEDPTHTEEGPVMDAGVDETVTDLVT